MLMRFVVAVIAAAPALVAGAQESISARDRLLESASYIAELPAYSVDIAMSFEMAGAEGETNRTAITSHLSMAGGDRARFRVNIEEGAMELFYAPDSNYIYLETQNQYVEGAAFGDREKALTMMPGREYRTSQLLLSAYLHNSGGLLDGIETVAFAEREGEDGVDEIRAENEDVVTRFWIRQGDAPLLEKLELDLSPMVSRSNPEITKATITYTFENWNTAPEFGGEHFAFVIPEGAAEFKPASRPADPLEGKAAPDLTLELLDGSGRLELSKHRGKNVVILDFWASWCGPCRIGLPIVTEVANAFQDRGVVLYAVNVAEDRQRAEAFVRDTGLTAPVALDANGVAQRLYGANSIPKTVIIDREGVVREVHAGVSPSLKSELTQALTELTQEASPAE